MGLLRPAILACAPAFAVALFFACAAPSRAATEFCPAKLVDLAAPRDGISKVWYYRLQGLGPRTVQGTIIADTDQGWFKWTQAPVQLTQMTFTRTTSAYRATYDVAESPKISVAFPGNVTVRQAWVVTAKTQGDDAFGWDARGSVPCGPPDFAPYVSKDSTQRTPQPGDPTPAPAPPTAVATRAGAPFTPLTCDHPFTAATLSKAAEAEYPPSLKGLAIGDLISVVYVAIDPAGKVVDAWTFASSGFSAADDEAIKTAKKSLYIPTVSYCRPAGGTYLFQVDFLRD